MRPQQIVQDGYDRMAEKYRDWAATVRVAEREKYTQVVLNALPPGAALLELGCGCGLPTTQTLAQKFRVTGVDLSARQVGLARGSVPRAHFVQADMTQLGLAAQAFDAVTAFYAFGHIPRAEQPNLLQSIAHWLKPGGWLVAAFGASADPGTIEADWLGVPSYFSSWDAATNQRLVREAGLHITSATEETAEEDGDAVTFLWIIARKPK